MSSRPQNLLSWIWPADKQRHGVRKMMAAEGTKYFVQPNQGVYFYGIFLFISLKFGVISRWILNFVEDKVHRFCNPNAEVNWVHCAHVGAELNSEQMQSVWLRILLCRKFEKLNKCNQQISLKKGATNYELDATQPTSCLSFSALQFRHCFLTKKLNVDISQESK